MFCLAEKMVSKQRVVVSKLSVKVIHIYHKFINMVTSSKHLEMPRRGGTRCPSVHNQSPACEDVLVSRTVL